jgi:glycosyltransferase involved in cell wall biosynthesis
MPVLNGEAHLVAALDSALAQLAPDDEIVVIDNGSTDGSVALVEAHPDPRIRLLHETKPGPAAARNAGLAEVRGDFVSMLDCDDLWPAGRLAALLPPLAADPDVDATLGRIRLRFDVGPEPLYDKLDGTTLDTLVLGTFVFRTSFLRRLGPFDEKLHFGEDGDFLLRARHLDMRTATIEADALIYRRHATNMTRDRAEASRAIFGIIARHLARRRGQS